MIFRKRRILWEWGLISAFVLLAAAAFLLLCTYTRTDREELYLTPVFTEDMGWEIYRLDEDGERLPMSVEELWEASGTVYLTRRLEKEYELAGYTFLRLQRGSEQIGVFLDGEPLYTPDFWSWNEEIVNRGESTVVSLPPGYGGRVLTLEYIRGMDHTGLPGVILSSMEIESALTVAQTSSMAMPAAVFMAVAVFLAGLWFYGLYAGSRNLPLLLLAATACFQSLYQLREYEMRLSSSVWDSELLILVPPLLVMLPLVYLLSWARLCRGQMFAVFAVGILTMLLKFCIILQIPVPGGGDRWGDFALVLMIFITLGLLIRDALRGGRASRLFLLALCVCTGTLGIACLFSLAGSGELAGYIIFLAKEIAGGWLGVPLFWCGVTIFLLCSVLAVEETVRNVAESRVQARLLSSQVEALQSRMETVQVVEEQMRIERHDLRHRLLAAAALVERGERQAALDYLGEGQRRLEETAPRRWCEGPVLNAVFDFYYIQARQKGIRVEFSLEVPSPLPVDERELSMAAANALENAMNACMALPEGQRRILAKVSGTPRLVLQVENTFRGEIRFDGQGVPVADRPGHGTGSQSILAFCKRHNAVWDYRAEDGWFRLRVAL